MPSTSLHPSFHVEPEELENQTLITTNGIVSFYEATRAGEKVLVKKLTPEGAEDPNSQKEFESEVLLLSNLHSSYVIALYGASLSPPNIFQVLEHVGSLNLSNFLYETQQLLSWEKRWSFARDLAVALNYLHSHTPPIIHGQIRSDNLLISEDGKLKVSLSKFGLQIPANVIPERWLAPEVAEGGEPTEASDVFGYGTILYELAARKVPFPHISSGQEIVDLWKKGEKPQAPPPDDTDFEPLYNLCWSTSPSSRPSIKDIVKDFKKKGKISTVSTEKLQGRMADEKDRLQREHDIFTQLKENLEKKAEEALRIADREAKRAVALEEQSQDLEKRYNEERIRRTATERENGDIQRNLKREAERVRELEENKKESEKKARDLQKKEEADKRVQEERALEDAEKRIQEERTKTNKIKLQLEDAEKKADAEEIMRQDTERRLQSLMATFEKEKKLREEALNGRDVAIKKLKTEKRKADLEKKKTEELEKELEEELERLRKRRV
eukprot:TRINITY_DN5010_c0_g6_i1.p1 TRINITY_DN5010_c0_g6~~TRINITY_DN5010_c0_g6_i1.p1  ORF type:complete len:510 (+),score=159.15 TRINITY_DN5010_c0_g6_i1:35-1531(+)